MISPSTRFAHHDTAAHIQLRPVMPNVVHASDARDRFPVGQTPSLRNQVEVQDHFPVPWRAVFEIVLKTMAVENGMVLVVRAAVGGYDLFNDVVDLGAVLMRGVYKGTASQGNGGSGYIVTVPLTPGNEAGGETRSAISAYSTVRLVRARAVLHWVSDKANNEAEKLRNNNMVLRFDNLICADTSVHMAFRTRRV
ncbi:MAG: hypothetical protein Q9195_004764 [Heterodermia aff. obscurata]